MMIVYVASADKEIPLGHCGEHIARQIRFDVSGWRELYGDGTVALLHERYGDPAPYPCVVEQDGDTIIWTITNADTAKQGRGNAELQYRIGDVLVKSSMYTTKVDEALGDVSETPPEPYESWVNQVLEAAQAGGASPEQIAAAVQAYLTENPVSAPVDSVNGKTGVVELTAADVGALSQTELQSGVYAALAQASESGAFDGAQGPAGPAGADGQDGADGYSPTANVTQTDTGAVITITDKTGTTTATLKNGADGQPGADGEPGPAGTTPNLQIGTVETLPAGSPATASMTGTAENPLLNLGIPKGADGSGGTDSTTEKNWKLIGSITTEEAVNSAYLTIPDDMTEVLLYATQIGGAETAAGLAVFAWSSGMSGTVFNFCSTSTSTSNQLAAARLRKIQTVDATLVDFVSGAAPAGASPASSGSSIYVGNRSLPVTGQFTGFKMTANANTLPVGFTFSVYGR